jgi:predicted nucleic acid-binding protein
MPSKPAVYWDSCVFLDRLKRHTTRITLLESITDAAAAGDFMIVTSSVALAEVIKLPDIGLTPPEQVARIEAFFQNPWLSIRIVDEVIAKMAAEIRRTYGVKTCDAIHVATALRYQIPALHTYDGLADDGTIKPRPFLLAFDGVFGDGDKLRIELPSDPRPPKQPEPEPAQQSLFTKTSP